MLLAMERVEVAEEEATRDPLAFTEAERRPDMLKEAEVEACPLTEGADTLGAELRDAAADVAPVPEARGEPELEDASDGVEAPEGVASHEELSEKL